MEDRRSISFTRRHLIQAAAGSGGLVALSALTRARQTFASPVQAQAGSATANASWTVALDFTMPVLDFATSGEWRGITGHIYDSLVDTVGSDFHLVNRLPERWEQRDPHTMRFYLRKGVKFHNGAEVTANDVKYSLQLYATDANPYPYIEWIDNVQVVDPYTVDVFMKRPNIIAIYDLCRAYIAPMA